MAKTYQAVYRIHGCILYSLEHQDFRTQATYSRTCAQSRWFNANIQNEFRLMAWFVRWRWVQMIAKNMANNVCKQPRICAVNECSTIYQERLWKIRNKRYCIKRHIKHSHMTEDSRTNGDDENWRHNNRMLYESILKQAQKLLMRERRMVSYVPSVAAATERVVSEWEWEWELYIYAITTGAVFMLILSFRIANGKRYASDTRTWTRVQWP